MSKDRFHVASAGTAPTQLHPLADRVMGERGVSMGRHQTKGLATVGTHWDYVIPVCDAALEECPDFPLKTSRLHWSVSDPAAVTGDSTERIEAFQRPVMNWRRELLAGSPIGPNDLKLLPLAPEEP